MRDRIITEARSWIGTPYLHKQRSKGYGVDCVQFLVGVALNVGIISPEEAAAVPMNYSPRWHLYQNEEVLEQYIGQYGCVAKNNQAILPGDIMGFRFGRVTAHVGIFLGTTFIHALWGPPRRVIEARLSVDFKNRWTRTYAFRGVE